MNSISATMYRSKFARAAHPVLTVDSIALGSWIKGVIYDGTGVDTTDGLVPAQGWLTDENHSRHAWQILEPAAEDCSTIVPLLVCADDLDLSCTVAVVSHWPFQLRQGLWPDRGAGALSGGCMSSI
jgi:hypothetical protein